MVRFFINLKPKNSCYIRNYEEKCKGGCECDHSKIEVRAEQFLKCGRACAAQENTSQPNGCFFSLTVGQNNFQNKIPYLTSLKVQLFYEGHKKFEARVTYEYQNLEEDCSKFLWPSQKC